MSVDEKVIEGEIVPSRELAEWTPRFVVTVDEAVARHDERIDYMKRVLKENVHYGVIPGTKSKPTLLKPGAEALCADMGLRPDPVDDGAPIVDIDGRDHNGEPFIYYQRKVNLYRLHPQTGARVWVGAGSGSCSSWEDKYRWRLSTRTCPECGKAAIIKGKAEYGGGWVCFRKKDGCGATFGDEAISITSQAVGKVPNDRIADLANTILKMADKRALIAAVLNTTGVSDLFTQDMDDDGDRDADEAARAEASKRPVTVVPKVIEPKPGVVNVVPPPPAGDSSGLMSAETRSRIDDLRVKPQANLIAAQAQLKEWRYATWGSFLVRGTQLQGAEIERVLATQPVSA